MDEVQNLRLITYIFKVGFVNYVGYLFIYFVSIYHSYAKSTHFNMYIVGSKSFRPDIQKPRQMENAVRDI